ncbi:hypothetical protein [Thermomonas sp.]|uniref:hypothetical protein n=1 Tax=Thermomonas sp. TaxID=1971895 RepID=UPI0026359282|nr:hypothetical protein [Thermomonas sp.]MCO5055143.1 hypothetical protein [Thermomonas sp.]
MSNLGKWLIDWEKPGYFSSHWQRLPRCGTRNARNRDALKMGRQAAVSRAHRQILATPRPSAIRSPCRRVAFTLPE